jgi:hypothetical protein
MERLISISRPRTYASVTTLSQRFFKRDKPVNDKQRAQRSHSVDFPRASALWRRAPAALAAAMLWLGAGVAHAAVTAAQITTGTSVAPTGAAPFNSLPADILPAPDPCTADNNLDYTPGNDACGADLVVRTNDDVTYNIQYATSGADTVTIVSTLPSNGGTPIADWRSVPPQCTGAGSAISADGQTLTCIVSVTSSAAGSILPQATVRGTTPNGTAFPIPSTVVSAAGGGNLNANANPLSTAGPVVVSAAPLIDVAKRNSTAPNFVNRTSAKGPDGSTDGWLFAFDLALRVPYGGKGVETLDANGISFEDVIGNIAITDPTVQAAFRANAQLYNADGSWVGALAGSSGGCWPNALAVPGIRDGNLPGVIAGTPNSNSIALSDNGVCTAAQAGGAGSTIDVRITGANWTNTRFPTMGNDQTPLAPPYDNYIVADQVGVWVPASVFAGLPVNTAVTMTNTYTNVAGSSVTGQPLTQPSTPDASQGGVANDSVSTSFQQTHDGGASKYYFNCGPSESPACSSINTQGNHLRDGVAVPGQAFSSALFISNQGTLPLDGAISCDKVDNTKNIVAIAASTGSPLTGVSNASDGINVPASDYLVEYGTGGADGIGDSWANNADFARATCAQDQSPAWYTDASDPAIGGLDKITKVRISYLAPIPPFKLYQASILLKDVGTSTVAGFGSPAATVWPVGTPINNWQTFTVPGLFSPNGDTFVVDSTGTVWNTGGIAGGADGDPYLASGVANYGISDTITQTSASARIVKTTTTPANSASQVVAGSAITYSLDATFSSPGTGPASSLRIVDVLPPHVSYVANSASLAPSSVQGGVPSAGYTTITWDIASATPNAPVAAITFQAITDATAANGTQIPNFTLISSPADATPCSASGGDYDQILGPGYVNNNATGGGVTGTLCLRAARRDLSLSSPPGFNTFKSADRATIEPGNAVTYTLNWLANGSSPAVIDLIDVLSYAGDGSPNPALNNNGRVPASAFGGSRALLAVPTPVSGDPGATFWYTSAAAATIDRDPQAVSNGAFGAPGGIWCGAIGAGGATCPATLAAATAIRMVSGTALQDGVARSFSYTVGTAGNANGDDYANDFSTRGAGLTNLVTSNDVATFVRTGTLSGTV